MYSLKKTETKINAKCKMCETYKAKTYMYYLEFKMSPELGVFLICKKCAVIELGKKHFEHWEEKNG